MTPGIPGVSLGGLFFIICALLAPVFELVRTVRGQSSPARWRLVLRQAAMAASIVLVTTATLWLLELIVLGIWGGAQEAGGAPEQGVAGGSAMLALEALERLPLAAAPVLVTFVVLVFVLGCAEVLRLVLRTKPVGEEGVRANTSHLRKKTKVH